MKEKKTFILAIPTMIIIVVAVVGIFLIFYKRNVKEMTREDVKNIAQKVAVIDNISCEIVTEGSERDNAQSVVDYKLKDRKMFSKTDFYTIYDDENDKTKIQMDENEKIAYIYKEYKSEITSFQEMICTVVKMLESPEYQYNFLRYETMNGIKCVVFNLENKDSKFNVWLDKSTGMIVKMECNYHWEGEEDINTVMHYRYQIGNVTDEDIAKPDLTGYSVVEL